MSNIARVEVTVKGTRTLLQHRFTPDAIALEKREKTGVAGNDPEEWKRTRMVQEDGRLYLPPSYIFGCLVNGAKYTKKGRGSYQPYVQAALTIEDEIILLNRKMPEEAKIKHFEDMVPRDLSVSTFVFVTSVKNPNSKGRNVRYRLATRSGWQCTFIIAFDVTLVGRSIMQAIVIDSGRYCGLGDGLKIGAGRFEVVSYKVLEDADAEDDSADLEVEEPLPVKPGRNSIASRAVRD